MSGVEVLEHAMAVRPETTRLLFTAYADIHAVVDAINQGNVFRYLAKPFDPDDLVVVVRQAVEHHNLIVEKNSLLAELQESNARLVEANRVKGAFIEVASHELNTPLTVVLGDDRPLENVAELDRLAARAAVGRPHRRRAARLASTVDRMLKLVRNREFNQSLDLKLLELGPIIEGVIEEISPYLELRRQTVSVEIEEELGSLEVDPTKIADVLINLLANAIKFTPDGGTITREGPHRNGITRLDSRRGQRPRAGRGTRRPAPSVRAIFHRLRHAAAFFGRIPVRQARNRAGPLPGQNFRAASRRPRRSLEHRGSGLDVQLRLAAIAAGPAAGITRRIRDEEGGGETFGRASRRGRETRAERLRTRALAPEQNASPRRREENALLISELGGCFGS